MKSTALDNESPEEGEIISDDLEDISDDSIPYTPNFVESEVSSPSRRVRVKRRKNGDARPNKKRKKQSAEKGALVNSSSSSSSSSSSTSSSSNSSSSDEEGDPTLKLQLKAAVQVDTEEARRKSLRTRLLAMTNEPIEILGSPESDLGLEQDVISAEMVENDAEQIANAQEHPDDNDACDQLKYQDIDNELMELRLEALKTTFANRFVNKRKRKKQDESSVGQLVGDDTNKENSAENPDVTKMTQVGTNDENDEQMNPEDDEDVLRALLLASMAKKITKTQPAPVLPAVSSKEPKKIVVNSLMPIKPNVRQITAKPQMHKISNFKISNNFNSTTNARKFVNNVKQTVNKPLETTKFINIPKVKPLVINVDSDSDSDLDPDSDLTKKQGDDPAMNGQNVVTESIEITIEKYLKEQRSKVEAELEKKAQQTEPNKLVPNKGTKIPSNAVEIPTKRVNVLNYLPANRREEYRKLQRLLVQKKNALRKRDLEQSKTNPVSNNIASSNHKVIKQTVPNDAASKVPVSKSSIEKDNTSKNVVNTSPPNPDSTLRAEKSSLHLPSKYKTRLELLQQREIEAARREQERKHQTASMRTILKQLQAQIDGRLQIQDKYKKLRPLIKKLNEINKEQKQCDQEVEQLMSQLESKRKRQAELHDRLVSFVTELGNEKRKIDDSATEEAANVVVATPPKALTPLPLDIISQVAPAISNQKNKDCISETKTIIDERGSNVNNNAASSLRVAEKQPVTVEEVHRKTDKLNYVSPLNFGLRLNLDPLQVLCPFEVNGTCKDSDCSYNHLYK